MTADATVSDAVPAFVELLEDVTEFPVTMVPTAASDGPVYGEVLRISQFFWLEPSAQLFVEYAIASGIRNVALEEVEEVEEVDEDVSEDYYQVHIGYRVTFDSTSSFGTDRGEQPFSRKEDQFIVAQYLWGLKIDLIASVLGRSDDEIEARLAQLGCRFDTSYFYESEAFTDLEEYKADMEAVKNEDYNFPDWSNHLASLHEYVADSFIPFACNSALGKIGVNCFDRFDSRQDVWVGDLTQNERRIIGDYLVFSGKPAAASLLAYRYEENWRGYLLGIESGRFSVPSSLLALWDCPPAIVRLSHALELRARTEEHQRSKHNEDHADDEDDFTF